jgi:hypothetical protein
MPGNLTTLAHFAVPSATSLPNSGGEPANDLAPSGGKPMATLDRVHGACRRRRHVEKFAGAMGSVHREVRYLLTLRGMISEMFWKLQCIRRYPFAENPDFLLLRSTIDTKKSVHL